MHHSPSHDELVVLVDEHDNVLGAEPKASVHGAVTPLHRGFSCFAFRAADTQLLLQQRSRAKHTWPLVWSNSCCGHPGPGESTLAAVRRRLGHELALAPTRLEEVAPYRYCFTREGVMENEICPIVLAVVDREPIPNIDEVAAVRWTPWEVFLDEIKHDEAAYSPWCVEEARILARTPQCRDLLGR